jgi:hypothetical protein
MHRILFKSVSTQWDNGHSWYDKTEDGYGWQGDHHTAVVSISDFSARPNNSNFMSSTFYLHV